MDKETRITKWKKYRTSILENHNIPEAIVNSDPDLKRILKQLNFDISQVEGPGASYATGRRANQSYQYQSETQLVNQLLEQIRKNENLKPKPQPDREYNSHTYDQIINDFFADFKTDSEEQTSTTNLKVQKVSLKPPTSGPETEVAPQISRPNIAIDGPSGVGKSSIAKALAKQLGLIFINTGRMYRALAYAVLQAGINPQDESEVSAAINRYKLEILADDQISLNDQIIRTELNNDQVALVASTIAKYSAVRHFCVALQQKLARETPGVVMEGRDIGTVVLPDAHLKVFLSAAAEVRAARRVAQLAAQGITVDHAEVLANVHKRDQTDQNRDLAPLVKAADAVEIDTSQLNFEEVLKQIIRLAQAKMSGQE